MEEEHNHIGSSSSSNNESSEIPHEAVWIEAVADAAARDSLK
jgi:hypothetical protein